MENWVHERLINADVVDCWETPPDYDYLVAIENIQLLVPLLSDFFQVKFISNELGDVQDASFIADVYHYTDDYCFAFRFSNFGKLFTIREVKLDGNENEYKKLKEKFIGAIQLIENQGYNFVPFEALSETYDGETKIFKGFMWYTRYFDYF